MCGYLTEYCGEDNSKFVADMTVMALSSLYLPPATHCQMHVIFLMHWTFIELGRRPILVCTSNYFWKTLGKLKRIT